MFGRSDAFRGYGVLQSDVEEWSRRLRRIAVVTPVDKMPSALAISCPRAWQARAREVFLGKSNVCRLFPGWNSVHNAFSELQAKLGYTGLLPRDVTHHQFGGVDVWPKTSNLPLKARPLGSYAKHCMRAHFSLACRALNFMTTNLCPESISVIAAEKVVNKFHNFSVDCVDKCSRGFTPIYVPFKRDIDNFFNNVPRNLISKALHWVVARWYEVHGTRRRFIRIPRLYRYAPRYRESPHCFSRAFKGHVRNLARANRPKPSPHNCRVVSADDYVLRVDDIVPIVNADLDSGFLHFGRGLFVPTVGMTQGSNLSPGVCNLVCCFFEFERVRLPPHIPCDGIHFVTMMIARWVDDIFGVLCFWHQEHHRAQDIRSLSDQLIEHLMRTYSHAVHSRIRRKRKYECLRLKVEDPAVFVGFNVGTTPVVSLSPHSKNGNLFRAAVVRVLYPRFQSWHCNRPLSEKVGSVQGLLVQCVDRCMNVDPVPHIASLMLELKCLEYPWEALRRAVDRVCSKHPYLSCLRVALIAAQEKWSRCNDPRAE